MAHEGINPQVNSDNSKDSILLPQCRCGPAPGDDFGPQYWNDLVDYAQLAPDEPPLGDFRKLQIINITHLVNQLSRIKASIENDETVTAERMRLLQQTLHQYADAIRDYQAMNSLRELPDYAKDTRMDLEGQFPYLATPYQGKANRPYDTRYRTTKPKKSQPQDPIREVLRKILPNRLTWPEEERKAKRSKYGAGKPPEMYSRFVDSVARFIIGTLGGCALIVPMVIMSLDSSLTKSLIVTSVSLVVFALVVGLVFETDNKDTIMATATYAAVLVVFVGNSGGAGGVASQS
ncbi:uncharacterized protein K460DRAFT_269308 [Cucurbitaria berberidis CBS 394.84]|uniref:DUF6594 domain-containing protein n=1 Tax=Cucurbitaria berberidis CBS 394.84 TaxID=1168544 RepID=A0A9P4GQU0_9PLEO|nr:uncharacterized protein K460DRAFT_269308 [Cucurbitaria berberidis CBS 394.84]KAF1850918.1 hypothetical protein K460DRAFT_269308 [Cucurbitaria berberidis CBS 394.84]